MLYGCDIKPVCKREINKSCRRNPVLKKILENKMDEIVLNPFHYKPLRNQLAGERRVHILKSFILVFEINYDERTVVFLRFRHHDDAYRG